VKVHSLELLEYKQPLFKIKTAVSSGTYIRTLVHDIGIALESAAVCTELERTKQGPFQLKNCLHKEDWTPTRIIEQIRLWNKHKITPIEETDL